MSSARQVARALARQRERADAVRSPIVQAVVTAVDYDARTATAQLADGTTFDVYPAHGVLPQVDESLTLVRNGDADLIALGGSVLVDGTFESPGHSDNPTAVGFGWYSDGRLVANEGVFRGTVAAAEFTTSEDEDDARVVISSANDARSVLLYSGADDELLPAALTSFVDGTRQVARLRGGEFEAGGAGKHASVDVGIDPVSGETYGECIGDDWRVNGSSISRPPYSAKKRAAAQGPIASSTSGNAAVVFDTDLKVNWASDIALEGDSFVFRRNGIYPVGLIVHWADGSGFGDGHRRYYVVENGSERLIGNMAAAGNDGIGTYHNLSTDVYVPTDDPFTLQLKVGQSNGFGGDLTFTARVTVKRFSAF